MGLDALGEQHLWSRRANDWSHTSFMSLTTLQKGH